jgi:hypothetical protein
MITFTFKEFADPKTDLHDEDCEMYVLRAEKELFYIGISKTGIWHRWFYGTGNHLDYYDDGSMYGKTSAGQLVAWNNPRSLLWKMDLWSVKDGLDFLGVEGTFVRERSYGKEYDIVPGFQGDMWTTWIDVKWVEKWMIRLLHPKCNGAENTCKRNEEFYQKYFEYIVKNGGEL